ncbi:MAG TPA: potassium channel family protein [Candidatus Saccharimonadales bacterium]|nr:potassium channel family protein [Candidatus Saccharimonadales bacterium]
MFIVNAAKLVLRGVAWIVMAFVQGTTWAVERIAKLPATKKFTHFVLAMTSKLRWVLLAYVLTRILAILIFHFVEKWSFVEAYWWSGVAALTIGYGDFYPKTSVGRILADGFQHFWIFYCGLAIGAHILMKIFKKLSVFTHREQEWLFWVVGLTCQWARWIVLSLVVIAEHLGCSDKLPPTPGRLPDGSLVDLPDQPDPNEDYEAADYTLPIHESGRITQTA